MNRRNSDPMKRILISLILFPIIVHAGNPQSKPKDLRVKMMVEILNRTPAVGSNAASEESLAHAYNIYTEGPDSGFGEQKKIESNDLQYSIPVFMCSAGSINGTKTYRIIFEAIHNPAPRKEELIDEDVDALMEGDAAESSKRLDERILASTALLDAFTSPIAKDNREFSLNEFEEYQTRLPNIIVKAGAYLLDNN